MRRIVLPEILDTLPPHDPWAAASRRDLQRLNRRMHSADLIARGLRRCFPDKPPDRLLEIGAGDGTLLLAVASRFAGQWTEVRAELLDQQALLTPDISDRFSALGWSVTGVRDNILNWASGTLAENYDAIIANLFLHHFKPHELTFLLEAIACRTKVFLALEPCRSALFMIIARLLWLMGCNRVTRHDAQVSVRAGFTGQELSALWPRRQGWSLVEKPAGIFSHVFLALKQY